MLISNALEKLKYFYIVFLSMFTLAGSVVGIIAAEIYLRISFPYFYMTQGLWSGSIEPVLSNGLYTGALLGMVTGSISLLSGERPMLRNEIFKTALRIVFLALITSLITGVTASILASLSPNIYRIFFLLPIFDDHVQSKTAKFAFVGGSIWGWYIGLVWIFTSRWYKARRIQIPIHEDTANSWQPPPKIDPETF